MATKSEILFKDYCKSKGIVCDKVKECEIKTTDYLIIIDNYEFICQVTEFIPNENEKNLNKTLLQKGVAYYFTEDEKRIRQKFKDKSKQLKNFNKYPLILILFDNRSIFSTIDSDSINLLYMEILNINMN